MPETEICPCQENMVLVKADLQRKATQAENELSCHCSIAAAKAFCLRWTADSVPPRPYSSRRDVPAPAPPETLAAASKAPIAAAREGPSSPAPGWPEASSPACEAGMCCRPPDTPQIPTAGNVAREGLIRHPGAPEPPPLPPPGVTGGMRARHSPYKLLINRHWKQMERELRLPFLQCPPLPHFPTAFLFCWRKMGLESAFKSLIQ